MLKKTLYFIYSIPFNLENVQVYINYLNKNYHQKKLFSETKKISNKKYDSYQIILGSITFEIEDNKISYYIIDEKIEDVVKAETKEVSKKAKNVAKKKNKKKKNK